MSKQKVIATIQYKAATKDWALHDLNANAIKSFKRLLHALQQADTLMHSEYDAITIRHEDRRIELLLAPVDVMAAMLRYY